MPHERPNREAYCEEVFESQALPKTRGRYRYRYKSFESDKKAAAD